MGPGDSQPPPREGRGQRAAKYTVRLYFSAPQGDKAGQRDFSVKLQGKSVLDGLDIAARTGGDRRALVTEFKEVSVDGDLLVELVARASEPTIAQAPTLCGLEVIRSGATEILR